MPCGFTSHPALLPMIRRILPLRGNGCGLLYSGPSYSIGINSKFFRSYGSDVEDLKSETGKNDADLSATTTGVMDYLKLTEVLMFYDNVYPRWYAKLTFKRYFGLLKLWNQPVVNLQTRVCQLSESTSDPLPEGTKVEEFVPLKRDGGAFVKFLVPPTSTVKDLTNTIEKNIQKNKEESKLMFKFPWTEFPRAYQVKGTPWIEDLSRFPSLKLKVLFEGEGLTEEELYLLFRRYGTIVDIVPPSSSTSYASVVFKRTDACIRAKNCVTGIKLNKGKTTLHLQYIPKQRVNYLKDFVVNHQRIAIPVIFALLATIAVLIFEPIREQFIEIKIKHNMYSWENNKDYWLVKIMYIPYRTIMNWISNGRHLLDDFGVSSKHGAELPVTDMDSDMFWSERSERANQVRLWICENANTFIVVKGPKGSGKREFVVDHALKINNTFSKRVLELDCDPLIKARSDNAFLKATAGQLGYFPLFTWTNSISLFVDLGLQGLTGQKSGLSETKEAQFKNMLLSAQVAIRRVALADYPAFRCEYKQQQQQKLKEHGEDGLDARVMDVKEEDYLQLHPEVKPVIVINNFLRKAEGDEFIFKVLADWAGQLILNNTAHVVFITLDLGSVVHLSNALPNQVFKTVSLADASPQSAKQYVMNQLQDEKISSVLDKSLDPIGGRMLDLQAFVRRVKSGEEPSDALTEMINQAAEQITTFFLNISGKSSGSENDVTWSTPQIWALMRLLAKQDTIEFDDLIQSPLFDANEETIATLSALEKNDLISLNRDKGIVNFITTGRPLYKAAFGTLVKDIKVFKVYETHFYKNLIAMENAKISKLEDEVTKLGQLRDTKFMKERLEFIFSKINASTEKVQTYEAKIKEIVKIGSEPKKGFLGF